MQELYPGHRSVYTLTGDNNAQVIHAVACDAVRDGFLRISVPYHLFFFSSPE